MNLKERAHLVDAVGSALSRGEHTLTVVPKLILQLLEEDAWREFETKMGRHVTYDHFVDFVTTPPLAGLGANVDILRRIVGDEQPTRDLLEQALGHPVGRPENHNNGTNPSPQGKSVASALRRLCKDRPDLHARVMAGELSANKAMVEAGFRPRRASVNLDSPKSAAMLIAKVSPELKEELRKLLNSSS